MQVVASPVTGTKMRWWEVVVTLHPSLPPCFYDTGFTDQRPEHLPMKWQTASVPPGVSWDLETRPRADAQSEVKMKWCDSPVPPRGELVGSQSCCCYITVAPQMKRARTPVRSGPWISTKNKHRHRWNPAATGLSRWTFRCLEAHLPRSLLVVLQNSFIRRRRAWLAGTPHRSTIPVLLRLCCSGGRDITWMSPFVHSQCMAFHC